MTIINPNTKAVGPTEKRKGRMRSIRTKITFWSGLFLALVSLTMIGYSVFTLRRASIDNSTKEAVAIAEAKAGSVAGQLDLPLLTARTLANSLGAAKDTAIPISLSRDAANGMLREVLLQNPSFLGTYTLWEPNAFDGLDTRYVRAVAHDETGRFIPYWVRGDDGIIHTESLAKYEVPGEGDWYIMPRSTKQEMIVAPIFRQIQGQEVVIASFIIPIIQNDQFYGIAGVDAPIGFVQELVDNVDLYDGTANAVLFTDTGTVIAARQHPELTNQSAKSIYQDFDQIQNQLGSSFTRLSPDGKYLQIFSPIDIGNVEKHWVMGLIIPFDKITAPATTTAVRQVGISAGLIILALAFLWLLAGQIVRPLQVLTDAARAVSQGKWNVAADVHSRDEAEVLADTFNLMTSELQNLFGTLEQRVVERTQALSNVADISIATSSINDPQEMLATVVHQTQRKFGLYHAHVFLYDEEKEDLGIVACGWKEGDEREGTHGTARIPFAQEQSLVARAARSKQAVIVNDVHSDPGWLPNPLLPDTASELAVPMLAGDKLIGVLDVQSDRLNAFSEEDAKIQTTLASQIAVAVQNARSYSEVQEAQQLTRTVIDSTNDWIFIKDRQHRYVLVNQGYSDALHIPAEAFIGKDDLDLGFPEELVKGNPEKGIRGFWSDDNLVLETGEVHHYPDDPATIDGTVHTFDTLKIPLRDSNGYVWAVLGFARDITERKRLEEQSAKHAQQQEAINLITQRIQSATTVEMALQVAARELGRALGHKPTIVALEPGALADRE